MVNICFTCLAAETATTTARVTEQKQIEVSLRGELAALASPDRAAPYNAAIADVLTIFDRHEQVRKKRSARAITQLKNDGKKTGGDLPYGFELAPDGETLRKCVAEQKIIAAAKKLRSEGHSLREVARRLAARNMFPREGDLFHAAQVRRILDEDS
jgi:DNA invertase Pin-like site-specific DNA recombinase